MLGAVRCATATPLGKLCSLTCNANIETCGLRELILLTVSTAASRGLHARTAERT